MRCHECGVKMQPPIASVADGDIWFTHNCNMEEEEAVFKKW
jgi:hypothetical protein